MELIDIVRRQSAPRPWAEGEKIPWNDPDFSRRMLKEHLSQAHDAASRRFEIIDEHVEWIHNQVLIESPRILVTSVVSKRRHMLLKNCQNSLQLLVPIQTCVILF